MSAPPAEGRHSLRGLLWLLTSLGAAGLALMLALWLAPVGAGWRWPASSAAPAPESHALGARGAEPRPEASAPEPAARAARVPGAPRRLLLPSLGVAAPVVPIKAVDGTLVPPGDPSTLGWWAAGARPGEDRGSALITGHTVHDGPAALNRLGELRRGDRVLVRTDRGRIRYAVRAVRVFTKGAVARRAEQLFDQSVPGRLVVVTCEDWDGERYLSNVVVTADPVGG